MSKYTAARIIPSINNQGNYEALQQLHSFSYYVDYINAINAGQKIFNEDGRRRYYDAAKITNRTIAGDFDNDGYVDDIAAFYDYGYISPIVGYETKIHVWLRNEPSNLLYTGAGGYRDLTGYNANSVTGRVVSGDFINDGHNNDIGAFYNAGTGDTRLHTWEYTPPSFFTYQGANGW